MQKTIYTFYFLIIAYFLSVSYDKGFQLPAGRCGVPNEMTCYDNCHISGRKFNASNITVNFGGNISEYFNDSTYTINLSMASKSNKNYGFQATIKDKNQVNIGTIIATPTSLVNSSNAGYINYNTINATGTFSFKWKAPAKAIYADSLYFYIAYVEGNKANGNQGDSVFLKSFTIPVHKDTTANPSSIQSVSNNTIQLFPSISSDLIHVIGNNHSAASIYNSSGIHIANKIIVDHMISVAELNKGLYYIQIDGVALKFIVE